MVPDTTQNNNTRFSLSQLLSENRYNIEIPIIQRDYAQGRPSATEVRKIFVSALFDHLTTAKNIDLDFVYGSLKGSDASIFTPLDGQQRLTTLFLLHWYLAQKEGGATHFQSVFTASAGKSRFTYETRASSREFCNALVSQPFSYAGLLEDSVAKTIEDAAWFYLEWKNDPTIQSILVMLDEIHSQFKATRDLYKLLIDIRNPVITFQYLNLETFKLTDDLYIKMNARGKQLTAFENFKAKLEQHIKQLAFGSEATFKLDWEGEIRNMPVHEYFSFKIDTEWANLFWYYKDANTNLFDVQLMNFIRVVLTNMHAAGGNVDNEVLGALLNKEAITFSFYESAKLLTPGYIINLIKIFDFLTSGDKGIKKYLANNDYLDEEALFKTVISNNISYTERIRFYAICIFLIKQEGNTAGLQEWSRIVFNLTENTIYNVAEEYVQALGAINRLLPYCDSILEHFSNGLAGSRLPGMLELQVKEEVIKAALILKSERWKREVIAIEKHGYFKGQISFLLNFSGIEQWFAANNNRLWDDSDDTKFLESLLWYYAKAVLFFNNKGLVLFENFVFERALLTKGDYTLGAKSNYSFLIDIDRDISWKRLLRDDNQGNRNYVKALFDDERIVSTDVQASLQKIIDEAVIDDWRQYFVKRINTIKYLGKQKYIRYLSEEKIFLLQKERMSSYHVEYYSYAMYNDYFVNHSIIFFPFEDVKYIVASGDDEPTIRLSKWSFKENDYFLDIYKVANADEIGYRIEFAKGKEGAFDAVVLGCLEGMVFDEEADEYFMVIEKEADAYEMVVELCKRFGQINSIG